MAKLKLTSPWHTYYNELKAFFREDPQVTVLFDEDDMNIKLLVRNEHKAEALTYLLNDSQQWGDTKLTVTVVPANVVATDAQAYINSLANSNEYIQMYSYALSGNDEFNDLCEIKGAVGFNAIYVVFEKNVIQYYTDNLGDLHGVKSTLMEYIARDIFVQHPGVYFSTEVE